MCWKYEWAKAANNLNHAIIHVERARKKIHARLLRNKKTLKKLSKSKKYNCPAHLDPVKALIKKNSEAEEQCRQVIADFKEKQDQLRRMIDAYGIKMSSKKSRMTEKLMKGKRTKIMVKMEME